MKYIITRLIYQHREVKTSKRRIRSNCFITYLPDCQKFSNSLCYGYSRWGGALSHEPMVLHLGNPAITVYNSLVYSPNGEVIEFLEKAAF